MNEISDDGFPSIVTNFDSGPEEDNNNSELYNEVVRSSIKKILPKGFFSRENGYQSVQDKIAFFDESLPQVMWSTCKDEYLTCYLVCRFRPNAFKFLFEMNCRWLVPGKRLNVVMFFAADFRFIDGSDQTYTVCELKMRVEDKMDMAIIKQNLPSIETELRLGTASVYHAQRILDIKGLSADEKTAMVQEQILNLINTRPQDFDHDLLTEMQHFHVICRDSFKAMRESRHMSRIICAQYLFRRALQKELQAAPDKRHIKLKFLRTRLHMPSGIQSALGVLVGINFLKSNELLEEKHLLKAIKAYIPDIHPVEGSFFTNTKRTDTIHTMYLEVAKNDNSEFAPEEIKLLLQELSHDLKGRIEHLMHPIFMPYNEEEVMRNILSLSSQLKYLRDIPQVMISFDEQTDMELSFTVILLRILKGKLSPIKKMVNESGTFLKYKHDRTKTVGHIRKKYPKEATVFRVRLNKTSFLRADHSLDLYKARQAVVSELTQILGEFRDYNGGMISKQNELFCSLKDLLAGEAMQNEFLLENFFYSLTPVVMRTILEPAPLKTLFHMLLDTLEEGFFKGENYYLKISEEQGFSLMMITAADPSYKDEVQKAVESLSLSPLDLATSYLDIYDTPCVGFAYRYDTEEKKELFEGAVREALTQWEDKTFASATVLANSEEENSLQPLLPF